MLLSSLTVFDSCWGFVTRFNSSVRCRPARQSWQHVWWCGIGLRRRWQSKGHKARLGWLVSSQLSHGLVSWEVFKLLANLAKEEVLKGGGDRIKAEMAVKRSQGKTGLAGSHSYLTDLLLERSSFYWQFRQKMWLKQVMGTGLGRSWQSDGHKARLGWLEESQLSHGLVA